MCGDRPATAESPTDPVLSPLWEETRLCGADVRCVGAERVTLTAHVVNTSQAEVTEGTVVCQERDGPQGACPRRLAMGVFPGAGAE